MEERMIPGDDFSPVIVVTEHGGVKIDPAVEQDIRALKRAVAAAIGLLLAMNGEDAKRWRVDIASASDEARAAIKDLT